MGQDMKFMSVMQAAAAVGLGRRTVWQDIVEGRLKANKVGRGYVIAVEDFDAWVKAYDPASKARAKRSLPTDQDKPKKGEGQE